MYDKAKENLENLKKLGATIFHEIDATKMELHPKLSMQEFDRIVFNFPHAGFIGKKDNAEVIKRHQELVNGFFKNASCMLKPRGEVHVSHRIDYPYNMWKLEELASHNSLVLTECVNFDINDYPGYSNKRGAEPKCNECFPLGKCMTFKFQIANPRKRKNESMLATPTYPQEVIMNTLQWLPGNGIPNASINRHRGYFNNLGDRRRSLSRKEWLRGLISKHGKEK